MVEFTFKELGISYPFVIPGTLQEKHTIPNPEYIKKYGKSGAGGMMGGEGMMGGGYPGGMGSGGSGVSGGRGMPLEDEETPREFAAPKFPFKVQMVWRERPLSARLEAKRLAEEAAAEAAAAEAEAGTEDENLASDLNSDSSTL